MSAPTEFPVVLIHGIFGHGRQRPMWNLGAPYWPESALNAINPNHIIVDVGAISSDYDRACEVFYQLVGGTVDYGEEHARHTGHERFGETYPRGHHPHWSAHCPIHIIGHSMGATTGLELYQLLCADAFGVGSDHRWVRSLVSIAGPLTGSTFSRCFHLHAQTPSTAVVLRVVALALAVWFKLGQALPWLRGGFDFRANQWHAYSLKDLASRRGALNRSNDLGTHSCLPSYRIQKNRELGHMDRLFLLSIATSPRFSFPVVSRRMGWVVLLWCLVWDRLPHWWGPARRCPRMAARARALLVVVSSLLAWRRLKAVDFARAPSLCLFAWLTKSNALAGLDHDVDPREWVLNDGAVNIHSMTRPWFPTAVPSAPPTSGDTGGLRASPSMRSLGSTGAEAVAVAMARCESHISIDRFPLATGGDGSTEGEGDVVDSPTRTTRELARGRWYVYRVDRNHLAGTFFDREAPQLYRSLFGLIAREYEQKQQQQQQPKKNQNQQRHGRQDQRVSSYGRRDGPNDLYDAAGRLAPVA